MGARHTPGPWVFSTEYGRKWSVVAGRILIRQSGSLDVPELIANARLITAAPELLGAASFAERVLADVTASASEKSKARHLLRRAVRQAEGDA